MTRKSSIIITERKYLKLTKKEIYENTGFLHGMVNFRR